MKSNPCGPAVAADAAEDTGPGGPDVAATGDTSLGQPGLASAEGAVTALYQAHALGLIRLAHIMLGDRASAEDVVQEAFCGLYRRWSALSDAATALPYVRASVLNGCRSLLRRRAWSPRQPE